MKQFVPAFVDVTPGTANAGLPARYASIRRRRSPAS